MKPKGRPYVGMSAILVAAVLSVGAASQSAAAPAAAGAAKPIPLLRVGVQYPISHVDQGHGGSLAYQAAGLFLEGLVTLGPRGNVRFVLAKSVTRPSPITYVYHLRRGVKFWNGNELTATDVTHALNYYRYPGSPVAAEVFPTVRSVQATGRYTVKITLKHPDAVFQTQLAQGPGTFEKAFYDAHKATFGKPGTLTMGTGPWRLLSLDPTSGAELAANPNYWGGPVNIRHISLRWFASETSAALAMRGGQLDVAFPTNVRAFASASGANIVSPPGIFPHIISMTTAEPRQGAAASPWNDVHVRRAVAYALNRKDIIRAFNGPAVPLETIIPPIQLRHIGSRDAVDALLKSLPRYPFNLAKARQELAKSAYPQGFTADFNTLDVPFRNEAQALAAQLSRIGIRLNVRFVTVGEWVSYTGAEVGIQLTSPGTATPDPSYEPQVLINSPNLASYRPASVRKLIQEARATENRTKRLALYGRILKRVATDVPYVPVFNTTQSLAIAKAFRWPTYSFNFYVGPWAQYIKRA